ncbi:hypothetical protein FIBSPDRAFT_1051053 [Athelia psychrophila]|uniref:Uncharacterized protein n=1 Tax=Athelia psychrophila TaxID=1759441 RepID=A0A165ZUR1_9AGAM|nr:hypothetical protein FIBSPDRAFT_1051053 [Fibularhizoctonia sp. CBS 109695]
MFFSRRTVSLVLAAATTLVKAQSEVGDGTFFETGLGACGVYNVDTDYIVAVSEALFDSYTETSPGNPNTNVLCNRPISISCALPPLSHICLPSLPLTFLLASQTAA